MQRTLRTPVQCRGTGLHSGRAVTLALRPAPAGSGIRFRRTDVPGPAGEIPATYDRVVPDQARCTVLRNAFGTEVATVEHLMAALSGAHIDNALVEVDAAEVPIMDGSSAPFLALLESAGAEDQGVPRRAIEVLRAVSVGSGERVASLRPGAAFTASFEIDFPNRVIGRQTIALDLSNGAIRRELGRARTFGFYEEIAALRSRGLALGGSLENAVVVSGETVLNEDGLRFRDEFVRHKLLDAVGDLYLAGGPLRGHFHGARCGHNLNNQLLRALFADPTAWRYAPAEATDSPSVQPLAACA